MLPELGLQMGTGDNASKAPNMVPAHSGTESVHLLVTSTTCSPPSAMPARPPGSHWCVLSEGRLSLTAASRLIVPCSGGSRILTLPAAVSYAHLPAPPQTSLEMLSYDGKLVTVPVPQRQQRIRPTQLTLQCASAPPPAHPLPSPNKTF